MDFFGHKAQPKVMLNYDVITKCQCVNCPVQSGSECTKPKVAARKDMMDNVNSGNLQNILGPGMLKNAEMMKNMTPEMMMSMSREQQKSLSDEMMKNMSGEGASKMPKPENMPGPYCVNGVADCKDLDFSKMCICSEC